MVYVESFVVPIRSTRFEDYRSMAQEAAAIWIELGALSVMEAVAENAPVGEVTSFRRSVALQADEVVVVSYITYRDKAHRDQVVDVAMKDARMMAMITNAPFDAKRMIWGGFSAFVDAKAP